MSEDIHPYMWWKIQNTALPGPGSRLFLPDLEIKMDADDKETENK